jgi:DNA-binding MarR family transcriptional regulator
MSSVNDARLELDPQVGALLRIAWERLREELHEHLRQQGFDDLRPAHRQLVRYPPIDGLRPSQLAEALHLSRQTINDLLRDMEAMGYLELHVEPADGRARIIRYTDRGWRLFETGSRISAEVGERWAAKIGRRRYDSMVAALKEIAAQPEV